MSKKNTNIWLFAAVSIAVIMMIKPMFLSRAKVSPVFRHGYGDKDIMELLFDCKDCVCHPPNKPCPKGIRCCPPVVCARTNNCTMSKVEAAKISEIPLVDKSMDAFYKRELGGPNPSTVWFPVKTEEGEEEEEDIEEVTQIFI